MNQIEYQKITSHTTLAQVKENPYFAPFREFLASPEEITGKHLEHIPMTCIPDWDKKHVADGYERLRQLCAGGTKVFYPLRSAQACNSDPALRENVMFRFPGRPGAPFAAVCPGGGYEVVCNHSEGFPVANALNQMGFHAFIVNYRIGKNAAAPNPQDDLALAIRFILEHAAELGVSPENYAVIGFSAGGHLAGSFGTRSLGWAHYNLPRPASMILAYPVVTMGEYTHEESRCCLLGQQGAQDPQRQAQWSLEKQMDEDTPPVFLWQCQEDPTVPSDNSRLLYERLTSCGVPCEYHLYPGSAHGWGLADGESDEGWLERAVRFWQAHSNSNSSGNDPD